MKTVTKLVAGLMSLAAAVSVNAATLTFNGLTSTYGDGFPLGSNMSATTDSLAYTENGFVLTLQTPHTYDFGSHIGDAGVSGAQTYNWHEGADNGPGSYVTLTQLGGGFFNLLGLNFVTNSLLTVSATGYVPQAFTGSGSALLNFNNISMVTFSSAGNSALDNISVTPASVPEPESIALMLAGLGLMGAISRRRKQQ